MFPLTRGLKTLFKVQRPDSSKPNSFPSGHTTTAFMTATMLHKEYGYLSPWVTVGAYSCATATGIMRMANNVPGGTEKLIRFRISLVMLKPTAESLDSCLILAPFCKTERRMYQFPPSSLYAGYSG